MTNEIPKNIWLDRLDSMRDDCEVIPAYRNKDIGVPVDAYTNTVMLIKEIKAMIIEDNPIDALEKVTSRSQWINRRPHNQVLQDVIYRLEKRL